MCIRIFNLFRLNSKFHLQLSRIFYFVLFSRQHGVCVLYMLVCHEFYSTVCYFMQFLSALYLHGTGNSFPFYIPYELHWSDLVVICSSTVSLWAIEYVIDKQDKDGKTDGNDGKKRPVPRSNYLFSKQTKYKQWKYSIRKKIEKQLPYQHSICVPTETSKQ